VRRIRAVLISIGALVALAASTGCQLKPTKVSESTSVSTSLLVRNASAPFLLNEKTIVIDARPSFEFGLSHWPGAVSLEAREFLREPDWQALARRLALKGIAPSARIVVAGQGRRGQGDEGLVAWTLFRLGFKDLQIASIENLVRGTGAAEPPPRENVPAWSSEPNLARVAKKADVMAIALTKHVEGQVPRKHLIDVRTTREYFAKKGFGEGYNTPELGALNIPFVEFLGEDGRPNLAIKNRLLSLGWQLSDEIITIGPKDPRSAAVAFVLTSLGFTDVRSFAW
jgi:thiosulfate/3-mercaptopyruvate sulfurtransferase